MKHITLALLLTCAGFTCSFYESEVCVEPVLIPTDTQAEVAPAGMGEVVTFLKLFPGVLKELFAGEGLVRRAAIDANKAAGLGVKYKTRRRLFVFSTSK